MGRFNITSFELHLINLSNMTKSICCYRWRKEEMNRLVEDIIYILYIIAMQTMQTLIRIFIICCYNTIIVLIVVLCRNEI